jgi:choline kinase
MKVIIMAAGIGTRLKKRFGNVPKCCTDVGGESLISRILRLLQARGIHDIAVVTGYQSALVRSQADPRQRVRFYLNPFFNVTNSVASLWFARKELDGRDDVILMNGDMFFEPALLDQVIAAPDMVVMFADPRRREEADYRFKYADGVLQAYGKTLPVAETTGEYIGIAKIHRGFIAEFRSRVDQLVGFQQHGLWWEDALYRMCGDGLSIQIREVTDCFWAELDYVEDYERISAYLAEAKARGEKSPGPAYAAA